MFPVFFCMFPRGTYCCSCLQQTCAASISLLASLWFCSFFDAPQRDAVLLTFAANARCLSPVMIFFFCLSSELVRTHVCQFCFLLCVHSQHELISSKRSFDSRASFVSYVVSCACFPCFHSALFSISRPLLVGVARPLLSLL